MATAEDTPEDPYDLHLDRELQVVQNLRATMQSLLRVLESGRDDLVLLGESMDTVRLASERCRTEFFTQHQSTESSAESPNPEKKSPTKRKRQEEGLIGKTRKSS